MNARSFQASVGMQRFLDSTTSARADPRARLVLSTTRRRRSSRASAARTRCSCSSISPPNHFPWDFRYRPDLLPEWRDPGNAPDVDEYLRRQAMSAADYQAFVARLKRDFPGEPFLIVRFGDHQPDFAAA